MAHRIATRILHASGDSLALFKNPSNGVRALTNTLANIRLCSSDTSAQATNSEALSPNDVVNPNFINRNPRNLEMMGIAKKRKGWSYSYPTQEFHHRISLRDTNRGMFSALEHSSGDVVVSASTLEMAISRHLYSKQDVSAAMNIGRVMARRCLEGGITCMHILEPTSADENEKFQAFRDALEEGGLDLVEPEELKPAYEPGIDYDNEEEVANLKSRQERVKNLGEYHRHALVTRAHSKNKLRRKIYFSKLEGVMPEDAADIVPDENQRL